MHGSDRPRPVQQQQGDPERAGSEALHHPGQRARAAVGGQGLHQSAVRARGVEVWFSKLYQERLAARTTEAIVLWKSATETAAWKTLTRLSCRVCFPSARIRFVGPQGNESGATFSPALFYVGTRAERFEKAFAGIGAVWVVPGK